MWKTLLLILLYPVSGGPEIPEVQLTDLPAVTVVYDPALGGINCDADCSTVASGPLEDWMYEAAGACDQSLFGRTVYFPDIDLRMKCVDTGGMIRPMWSDYYNQTVLFFDVLWSLEKSGDGRILGAPAWNYQLMQNWAVVD